MKKAMSLLIAMQLIFITIIAAYSQSNQISITIPLNNEIAITCQDGVATTQTNTSDLIIVQCNSLLPTTTPTLTDVPTLISTATPLPTIAQNIAPKDYPLCAEHDITKYHKTINDELKCHYDHSHGSNPTEMNDIFGSWTFGDETISYPHASSPAENMYTQYISSTNTTKKHAGMFYFNDRDLPDSPVALPNWNTPVENKVVNIRAQAHFWGIGDTKVRFHSTYYEIQIKNKITGKMGIVRVGGLMDTGILQLYKEQWIPILGQDPSINSAQWFPGFNSSGGKSFDPYRGYKQTCAQIISRFGNENFFHPTFNMGYGFTSMSSDVLWSLAPNVHGYNLIAGISFQKFDSSDCISSEPLNLTNPYSTTYSINNICDMAGRPNCRLNGTEVANFMIFVIIPKSWDNAQIKDFNGNVVGVDSDLEAGVVTFSGYTNQKQQIVSGCTFASYDCIPLILENAPVGQSFYQKTGSGKTRVQEFDLTPVDHIINGVWESWHRQ